MKNDNTQAKQLDAGVKVFITGSTGFVGSHLVFGLVKKGCDVHVLTRNTSDLSTLKGVLGQVTVHEHDGTTENLVAIIKNASPVIVFHLASLFLAQHKTEDVEPLIRSNVLFAAQLVEAMAVNNHKLLVNTGTSWQHFEGGEHNPVCLYAATKYAFEALVEYYVETSGISAVTLKLFDTYGPMDFRRKLFSILEKASESEQILQMSPGEQLIDLVHINDVIDAYVIAANRLLSGEVSSHEKYAVTSSNPISLKELVDLYQQERGVNLFVNWGGRPYRSREVMVPWMLGKILPGWHPKVMLPEGIKSLFTKT